MVDFKNEKFQELLKDHKDGTFKIGLGEKKVNQNFLKKARKLVLFYADFKCEYPKCERESGLTLQHLIRNSDDGSFNKNKFDAIRNYYGNCVILCANHHRKADNHSSPLSSIPASTIDEIKYEFGIKTETKVKEVDWEKVKSLLGSLLNELKDA